MSTPTPPANPSVSLVLDSDSYVAGQALTATATYADSESNPQTLTVSVSLTDSTGASASASTTATVVEQQSESMDGTPTDSFGDTYTEQSNSLANGVGTAVWTTTVNPPAGG
jgi:hypothetical protein